MNVIDRKCEEMKECILAIDAGGTVFKYALVGLEGTLLTEVFKLPIHSKGTAAEVLQSYDRLITHAKELSESIQGIGISTPGPFDYDNGISLMKHKFQSIYGISMRDRIRENCGVDVPIWFCPDTNAFLAGEYAHGAGNGYRNVIGITIGTGLGIAVVYEGKILVNEKKGPAEVVYNLPCKNGILEDYVSGRGIAAYYRRLTGSMDETITAKDVGMRALEEAEAQRTFDEVGYLLGKAISEKVAKYHAQVVIIGGQVANSFGYMQDGIERGIANVSCKVVRAGEIDHAAMKGVLELREMYAGK